MAIAYDAFSEYGDYDPASVTWTHTPVGTPAGVIVWVLEVFGSADTVTGVTYGGETMTELTSSPVVKSSGEACTAHCYGIGFSGDTVPTGAQTVLVSETAGAQVWQCYAVSVTADGNIAEVDVDTISSDSTASPSGTLTLGGDTAFCAEAFFTGDPDVATNCSPLTDWTSRTEDDQGVAGCALYTYDTIGSSDVTTGYTNVTADDVVLIAVAIKEAAGGSEITGSGTPASQDADANGTAERELPGSGTPAAQAADADGTGERVLTCSGTLTSAASSVDGTASLQLKVELTAATGRELRDEDGAVVASLANIAYEWYDKDTDTTGNPDFSGTFSTNGSGEATIQLPGTALASGQHGLLVLEHPSDNTIRGIYRIPVT